MNKHIHIHIHRTTDNDFKESDHPRASNGQFGSGGGGGKSGSSEKKKGAPAIPTKHSNRGATALAQMQAASNKHLEQTGKGHVVKGKEATRAEAEHGSAKSEYRTHAVNAQTKGQAALDLHNKAEASKDPKDKAAAAKAVKEAYEAHTAAGASHSKIPFPGASERAEHHAQRAAHYKKLMAQYGAAPAKDPKDMNDQELQEYLEKTNTRQTLKRG